MYTHLTTVKIEMWRGAHLPSNRWFVVKCHTSCVNIWVCSKDDPVHNSSDLHLPHLSLHASYIMLRWVFAYWTNGTSPNKWLKLENTWILSSLLDHYPAHTLPSRSKVGLIASIFSKVSTILWLHGQLKHLHIYLCPHTQIRMLLISW
jgi:hypothetical protein